jgi:hypothetical protein
MFSCEYDNGYYGVLLLVEEIKNLGLTQNLFSFVAINIVGIQKYIFPYN